ncbi:Phosphoinositide phosphatase SAC1 [Cyphellophora attinorum]|uniref:Phosphoinositide phosphatase SAC1 n=1 Tax=Cyphellophora attinorum TaxID=1664694 RepID=A0A0N1P4J9_9EURO|nr:Phosphoinositide phosphatase SAC1 [Phialophora attinorum]KPI45836.1 Phosphoinositide phosphatase SAC1 [Phialophora attinorum]
MATLPFRDINVHASASHYAFTSPSTPSAPTLVIERPSGDIRLNNGALLGSKRVSSIAGILGIIKLKLDKYIIVITKAQTMGRLRGHMLYKVVATEFLSLRERPVHDPDEDKYIAYLKTQLTGPMFFSYSLDVTNSFQRQAQSNLSDPLWKRCDDRFFWNRFIQTDLIDFRMGEGGSMKSGPHLGVDPYILPVMFGMLRVTPAKVKGTPFTFALITRRSRYRGGTRYFSRGIDADGHVSNFNETEQIVILNDPTGAPTGYASSQAAQNGKIGVGSTNETQIMSYVQTRGSVPVFWAEINDLHYTPKLQIRGVESAVEAARKHFNEQVRLYGENYLVNLVNQRGREERVKKAYEQMVRILVSSPDETSESDSRTNEKMTNIEGSGNQRMDRLHYVYFDFHNETKGLKWHRAELLLDELIDGLRKGQYFKGAEMPGDSTGALDTRLSQSSVVRTNCMDCLDRTNVVQSMLGRWAISQQLTDAGILNPGERAGDDREFETLFRNMWADNADVVSNSYSGTGALKTDFTRTGNRTRAGMAQDLNNSITRYVKNNFLDGPRQDGFDLFLGTYLPSTSGVGSSLTFADRRPLLIQAVPYVLAGSLFFVFISMLTRRAPESTVWPLRLFILICVVIAGWALQFIVANGMLYVNWPKLNTPQFAAEGYSDALARAHKDKIVGQFITSPKDHDRRARKLSTSNVGFMEEGKKRIE